MATFEEAFLAWDFMMNFGRQIRNMRSNAIQHKVSADNGSDFSAIANKITGDGKSFLRRSEWVKEVIDDPARRSKLQKALLDTYNIDIDEVEPIVNDTIVASTAMRDANKRNKSEIDAICDATLSAIPDLDGITNGRNQDR